jgi:hypothetical protein
MPTMNKVINFIDVTYHKILVFWFVLKFCLALLKRAITHDISKYSEFETPYYEELFFDLLVVDYGSAKYYELIGKLKPAKLHHYSQNRHHPEHWENGASDMSPLDLVEMLCDWKAAGMGNGTGNMTKSIEVNSKKYNLYTESLLRIAYVMGLL